MIDTHCHLTWPDYDADREAVIQRAWDAGLAAMITIGAGQGIEGNRKAIALAEQYENIYAAVGLHPHDAKLFTPVMLAELEALAQHPKVVAIGETGLDYHYDFASPEEQYTAFQAQLELAHRCHLPVIIHHREAEEDLLLLLHAVIASAAKQSPDTRCPGDCFVADAPRNDNSRLRGVVHCFGGTLEFAQRLLDLGFQLGIGGVVTFKNAEPLRQAIRQLPLDRLILETDAPYLAPVPYRGKRNEPAHVRHVAATLASLCAVSEETIIARTSANSKRLFALTI